MSTSASSPSEFQPPGPPPSPSPSPFPPSPPSPASQKATPTSFPHQYQYQNGVLYIPGAGYYRVTLSRGIKDLTSAVLSHADREEVMKHLAHTVDAIIKEMEQQSAPQGSQKFKAEDLGDSFKISSQDKSTVELEYQKQNISVKKQIQSAVPLFDKVNTLATTILSQQNSSTAHGSSGALEDERKHGRSLVDQGRRHPVHDPSGLRSSPLRTVSATGTAGTTETGGADVSQLSPEEEAIWLDKNLLAILKECYQSDTPENKKKEELQLAVKCWLGKRPVNSFKRGERFNERTIADALQGPGNEALRDVILKIAEGKIPEKVLNILKYGTGDLTGKPLGKPDKYGEYAPLKFFLLKHLARTAHKIETRGPAPVKNSPNPESNLLCSQEQFFVKGVGKGLSKRLNLTSGPDSSSKAHLFNAEITDTLLFVNNRGLSSENDKVPDSEKEELVGHCTNLGIVQMTGRDGKKRVTCLRSGRTDDSERLRENVFYGCVKSWDTNERVGFLETPPGSGVYEYQHLITSHMDFSEAKALFAGSKLKIVDGLPKIVTDSENNERERLREMMGNIENWPAEGIHIRLLKNKDSEDPKDIVTVILKKPIFINQIFSSRIVPTSVATEFMTGKQESQEASWPGYRQILQLFAKKYPAFGECPQGEFNVNQAKEFLIGAFQKLDQLQGPEKNNNRHYLVALYAAITGYYPCWKQEGQNYTFTNAIPSGQEDEYHPLSGKEVHAADRQMYLNIILNSINVVQAIQCKSGVDRTGLSVALVTAQARYKEVTGDYFWPYTCTDDQIKTFRKYVEVSLREFASPVSLESKGEWGLNWELGKLGGLGDFGLPKGNPVPFKYLPAEMVREYWEQDRVGANAHRHPYTAVTEISSDPYSFTFSRTHVKSILGGSVGAHRKNRAKRSLPELQLKRHRLQQSLQQAGLAKRALEKIRKTLLKLDRQIQERQAFVNQVKDRFTKGERSVVATEHKKIVLNDGLNLEQHVSELTRDQLKRLKVIAASDRYDRVGQVAQNTAKRILRLYREWVAEQRLVPVTEE